jgi:hypothetical protein
MADVVDPPPYPQQDDYTFDDGSGNSIEVKSVTNLTMLYDTDAKTWMVTGAATTYKIGNAPQYDASAHVTVWANNIPSDGECTGASQCTATRTLPITCGVGKYGLAEGQHKLVDATTGETKTPLRYTSDKKECLA